MHRGYIKLFRKVSDNALWTEEKFTRGQAWIDLIMLANHKDGHIRVRGIKVAVLRGQCGWSEVALADRWKWSRGKVRRFLRELEAAQQIEQQKCNVTSLIIITNYIEYQGCSTADSTTNGTANGQQTDTNKNVKNKNNTASDDADQKFYLTRRKRKLTGKRLETFEIFWKKFDYKLDKASAADAWMDIPSLTVALCEKIYSAAEAEAERRPAKKLAGSTPIYAQGWISARRWEDEVESEKKTNREYVA